MFEWGLGLGFVLGKLAGGRARSLLELPISGFWWLVAGFLVRWSLYLLSIRGLSLSVWSRELIQLLGYFMLLYGLWLNRKLSGLIWVAGGDLLNFIVIVLGAGRMAVTKVGLLEAGVTRFNQKMLPNSLNTHFYAPHFWLGFLADNLGTRWPEQIVFSPGDLLSFFAAIYFMIMGMRPPWLIRFSKRDNINQ